MLLRIESRHFGAFPVDIPSGFQKVSLTIHKLLLRPRYKLHSMTIDYYIFFHGQKIREEANMLVADK